MPFSVFFFFQAEDGIRDATVTGVQTCALPISPAAATSSPGLSSGFSRKGWSHSRLPPRRFGYTAMPPAGSEERRVGKECRSRWAAYQSKKKNKNKKATEQR